MLLLGKILYIEKKIFNIACQYLDIMDEYLLFEYLLFNIHFSPCKNEKVLVLCEKFSSNFYVLRPPESEKKPVFEKNFMKKSKAPILVSDSAHKLLPIILIIFFD